MIPKSEERYELEKKLQELINGYKTTAALDDSLTFQSPVDIKEILLYLQTVERLQDVYVVNCHQAAILQ